MPEFTPDDAKRIAAAKALELVTPGARLGLGTGTTAAHFVELLGARVAKGFKVICVPTSERTRTLAETHAIPLASIDDLPELDLTVDGTDEFDAQLRLLKGGGGALLREKIVAMAAKRMIVIADWTKSAGVLGKHPLPVEVNLFGHEVTRRMILAAAKSCGCEGEVRLRRTPGGAPFVSDNGHYIADCFFGAIPSPDCLAASLAAIPGVVEHGLFIGIARAVICAGPGGIEIFGKID
ncbi:MAG: ribose-5-phosphate isomerase RpiA [Beijerinckiaceae bacterium]|nr:ribose-5-phosphate isomerase RpiA [Beijerinckiaceae bacterium]